MRMPNTEKRSERHPKKTDVTIVHRGIKIEPIVGKRSPTAKAIRDALKGSMKKNRRVASG